MPTIYTFFENTIWSTILLTILIYFTMYINGSRRKVAVLFALTPSILLVLSLFLAGFTYSFYPVALDGHGFRVIFLYLPLVVLLGYFFTEDEKQDRRITLKIYTGIATLLFLLSVVYHPLPNGPSASNGWDEGVMEYSCQDEYYLIERNINLQMIDCVDNIFRWAEKKKTHICSIERNLTKDKTISVSDEKGNYYLFTKKCKFKRKEF